MHERWGARCTIDPPRSQTIYQLTRPLARNVFAMWSRVRFGRDARPPQHTRNMTKAIVHIPRIEPAVAQQGIAIP